MTIWIRLSVDNNDNRRALQHQVDDFEVIHARHVECIMQGVYAVTKLPYLILRRFANWFYDLFI